jgi:aquaporin Z
MISACGFAVLVFHLELPVVELFKNGVARRILMGLSMGGTVVALIDSPWERQSGAHLNPAVTLTYLLVTANL